MGTELPICPACSGEIANLASKCTVIGVPGHFHAGCADQGRMIRNLYRAGHIAGLREAAERCNAISANPTWSIEMISVYECALADAEASIRARITALEENGQT